MTEMEPSKATNRRQHQSTFAPERAPTQGRSHWSPGLVSLAVFLLLLIAIAGNILAPLSPAPTAFFASFSPSPIATQRSINSKATPLPTLLHQRAEVAYINNLISHMSLDDEIGQMIMIGFSETQMDPALAYEIEHFHVGSAIIRSE